MSPRARIDLCAGVADGSLVPGPRLGESLSGCLQCLACTEICGKGVDGAAIVLEERLRRGMGTTRQEKTRLSRWLERAVVTTLLPRRRWLARAVRVMGRLQRFLPAEERGTVRHVPELLMGGAGQRSLPQFSRISLFDSLPERVDATFYPQEPAQGHSTACAQQGEVAIFSGCFGGVVNTQAALALVRLLSLRGYTVHLPAGQSCCGAPALLSGFSGAFHKAQVHNAKVFAALGNMPILTLCATCHRTLTHTYGAEQWPTEDAALLRAMAERVVDAAVFMAVLTNEKVGTVDNSSARPWRVAVHDPCHLRLHPESGTAARHCLTQGGVQLVELPTRGQCCGGGGISSLKNPELADKLGHERALEVIASGADVVVAQCPGCVLQLNNHLSRLDTKIRAWHLLEFLGSEHCTR